MRVRQNSFLLCLDRISLLYRYKPYNNEKKLMKYKKKIKLREPIYKIVLEELVFCL